MITLSLLGLLCQFESAGRYNASHKNPKGSYDCGVCQVNQKTKCTEEDFRLSKPRARKLLKEYLRYHRKNCGDNPDHPGYIHYNHGYRVRKSRKYVDNFECFKQNNNKRCTKIEFAKWKESVQK